MDNLTSISSELWLFIYSKAFIESLSSLSLDRVWLKQAQQILYNAPHTSLMITTDKQLHAVSKLDQWQA